jgi:hypothetical protein
VAQRRAAQCSRSSFNSVGIKEPARGTATLPRVTGELSTLRPARAVHPARMVSHAASIARREFVRKSVAEPCSATAMLRGGHCVPQ